MLKSNHVLLLPICSQLFNFFSIWQNSKHFILPLNIEDTTSINQFLMTGNKSAVLFIVFNRYETASRVFEEIKQYQPQKLYIAADGPRAGNIADKEKCETVRQLANRIDWPCDLVTLFRDNNVGCKAAVSGAISWFFEHEEEGIILEDDCLPGESFFFFCDTLLKKYRNDHRIMHIAGTNLQFGNWRGNASYYFSSIPSIWGWASWRRVWAQYDKDMLLFEEFAQENLMQFVFPDNNTARWAMDAARAVYEGKIDTWDYQLAFSVMINNGLCVTPNSNLVSNIGFHATSRLTKNPDDVHANIPIEEIEELRHPKFFIPNRQADLYQLSHSMPESSPAPDNFSISRRIINKVKRVMTK
jgi:hypothetical protein